MILDNHNLKFLRRVDIKGEVIPATSGQGIAYFLNELIDLEKIKEALSKVDFYLAGNIDPLGENEISGELHTVYLNSEFASVFFDLKEEVLQELPLTDFKEILQKWLDFVSEKT